MKNKLDNLENKSTILLVYRLNEINKEMDSLEIEYNMIVKELKTRIPKLTDDVNLQPKKLVRCNREQKK